MEFLIYMAFVVSVLAVVCYFLFQKDDELPPEMIESVRNDVSSPEKLTVSQPAIEIVRLMLEQPERFKFVGDVERMAAKPDFLYGSLGPFYCYSTLKDNVTDVKIKFGYEFKTVDYNRLYHTPYHNKTLYSVTTKDSSGETYKFRYDDVKYIDMKVTGKLYEAIKSYQKKIGQVRLDKMNEEKRRQEQEAEKRRMKLCELYGVDPKQSVDTE